ncbi:MAG: 50S ribosomal protein L6 [Patescibacteria group bacterium]|nr:50S ribosomal protein L6 [Patescibacteria group bacterium]
MSRIGKQFIDIPENVEVKITDKFVIVKGPKGELKQELISGVVVTIDDKIASVTVQNPKDKKHRALWGLYQRLIANMVKGVTEGYEKKLELVGVGYKVALIGNDLKIEVGFSHPVEFKIPDGIEIKVEKNIITISGIDKQLVGEITARIRKIKKPEPYKGKGIRYVGEVVRRKAGKAAKTGAT